MAGIFFGFPLDFQVLTLYQPCTYLTLKEIIISKKLILKQISR